MESIISPRTKVGPSSERKAANDREHTRLSTRYGKLMKKKCANMMR